MRKRYWLIAIFVAVVCFIWGNSVLSTQLSSEISAAVGKFFASIFGTGDGTTTVGGLSVRKMAHFVEFAALGTVASLLFRILFKNKGMYASTVVLCGILVALTDETIQIFSGRGSSVRDIWIDVLGYSVGCLIVAAAHFVSARYKKGNTDIE